MKNINISDQILVDIDNQGQHMCESIYKWNVWLFKNNNKNSWSSTDYI
jgi:hypothetical protein